MTVRINRAESFSVFEVDQNGTYTRVLATAIELDNGRVDLTELLYFGKEIFQEALFEFRDLGIKRFWINEHTGAHECLSGMENTITQVNKGNEDVSGHRYYEFQFI